MDDPESFRIFGTFLEANFAGANSKNLCVECWCLCNRYQMSKHKELGHRLLTPKYFKDIETFINLAGQFRKYLDIPISADVNSVTEHEVLLSQQEKS